MVLGELCFLYESCGKCLTADPICSWCIDPNYDMQKPRCGTKTRLNALNCKEIYDNTPMQIEVKQNATTHDFAKDSLDAVQIQPQKVKLTLKRGNNNCDEHTNEEMSNRKTECEFFCRPNTKISNEISSGQKLSSGFVLFNGSYLVYAGAQRNVVQSW